MAVNPDFRDLFRALSAEKAEFLVVGGYAVMFFAGPRYTKDLDVWVRPSAANAARVLRALRRFGAPRFGLTAEELVKPGWILQIGVPPNRIDVINDIDGVSFEDAWRRRARTTYGGVRIAMLGLDELLANKRAVARPQDLLDAANLARARAHPPRRKPARKSRARP